MNIPDAGQVAGPTRTVADLLKAYYQQFKGCILVYQPGLGPDSEGFILIDDGTVLAAAYSGQGIDLYQLNALHRMMVLEDITSKVVPMTDDQIAAAIRDSPRSAIIQESGARDRPAAHIAKEKAEYDRILPVITALPGVVASALVADGLPVFQYGDADFEHIAAATEDMVRAGSRIAGELQLGGTDQIILETPGYKVIIAPVSDMFLCVLTRCDANLGLIRLNVRNMQTTLR